jgi:hypothetical protein
MLESSGMRPFDTRRTAVESLGAVAIVLASVVNLSAAAPRLILVSGPLLQRPILIDDWDDTMRIMAAINDPVDAESEARPVPENIGALLAVSTNAYDERADFITALSKTAEMVEGLLDALDTMRLSLEAGHQPTAGDLQRLREHSALWRQQLDRLRQRLVSATVEPTGAGPRET